MKKFSKVIAITLFVCALGLTSCVESDLNEDQELNQIDKKKIKPSDI